MLAKIRETGRARTVDRNGNPAAPMQDHEFTNEYYLQHPMAVENRNYFKVCKLTLPSYDHAWILLIANLSACMIGPYSYISIIDHHH